MSVADYARILLADLVAVHAGHHYIEEYQIGTLVAYFFERHSAPDAAVCAL
jgi:hypothetical protein